MLSVFFFFNDTATTEIYTLSLHDALPIFQWGTEPRGNPGRANPLAEPGGGRRHRRGSLRADILQQPVDRKSTRLNSSHANISYAVFCLKKKKTIVQRIPLSPPLNTR